MQRAKHADRRQATRRRLELGEAVEAAGAAHLERDEIIRILRRHLNTDVADQTADRFPVADASDADARRYS